MSATLQLPPILLHDEEPHAGGTLHHVRQPRVMVIAPGPYYATKDCYDAAVSGMRAAGANVTPIAYHDDLRLASGLEQTLRDNGEDHDSAFTHVTTYAGYRAVALAFVQSPDLILVVSGSAFDPAHAGFLGRYTRTAVWLTESPYQEETEYRLSEFYRTAFTNERRMVDRIKAYRQASGHKCPDDVYYLPHGYDPARHFPRAAEPDYASDVCFIGSPFPERQALLRAVDWTGIDFKAFGVFDDNDPNDAMNGGGRSAVSNDEAQLWYAGAKININHHRVVRYYGADAQIEPWEAESLNPRVYELAAGRCFQLCDDSREELRALFGDSVPTYSHHDPRDLERVVRYYLAHPDERERCAQEAYERVQGHAAEARMRFVLETCLGACDG